MRRSSGPSQDWTRAPISTCGLDGISPPCHSHPATRPCASLAAADKDWGFRSAWLIIASPKKVQSFSDTQPNEVRSEDAAVTIAVVSFDSIGTNTPEKQADRISRRFLM